MTFATSLSLNSLITLKDTVNVLSDSIETDTNVRKDLFAQILRIIKESSTDLLIRLRNKDPLDYRVSNAEQLLSLEVESRIVKLIVISQEDVTSIINHLCKPNLQQWWKKSTVRGFNKVLNDWNPAKASIILNWLKTSEHVDLKCLNSLIPQNISEADFLPQIKKDTEEVALKQLLELSVMKGWIKVHAACAVIISKVNEAFQKHQSIDPSFSNKSAIQTMISGFGYKAAFNEMLTLAPKHLEKFLLEILMKHPSVWAEINVRQSNWQRLWLAFSLQGNDLWMFIKDPKKVLYEIMDALIDNVSIDTELLNMLSTSSNADFLYYNNRSLIWDKLPSPAKENLLVRTSVSYLKNELSNNSFKMDDYLLTNCSSDQTITLFLDENRNNIHVTLPVFQNISSPVYLRNYLYSYNSEISFTDSILLGKLILKMGNKECAELVLRHSRNYKSFSEALKHCYSLLGFFDRIRIGFSGSSSEEDWWSAFVDLTSELYPEGPRMNKIWEEAGGKISVLDFSGNGKTQWRSALSSVRFGSTNINKMNLLKAMLKDFGNNEKLNLLKSYLEND